MSLFSVSIVESVVGCSLTRTRQNAGRLFCDSKPGNASKPAVTASAAVSVASGNVMLLSNVQSAAAKAAGALSDRSTAAEVTSKTARYTDVHFTPSRTLMSDGGERKHAVCLSRILESAGGYDRYLPTCMVRRATAGGSLVEKTSLRKCIRPFCGD